MKKIKLSIPPTFVFALLRRAPWISFRALGPPRLVTHGWRWRLLPWTAAASLLPSRRCLPFAASLFARLTHTWKNTGYLGTIKSHFMLPPWEFINTHHKMKVLYPVVQWFIFYGIFTLASRCLCPIFHLTLSEYKYRSPRLVTSHLSYFNFFQTSWEMSFLFTTSVKTHAMSHIKCILTQVVRKWIKCTQGFYKVTLVFQNITVDPDRPRELKVSGFCA